MLLDESDVICTASHRVHQKKNLPTKSLAHLLAFRSFDGHNISTESNGELHRSVCEIARSTSTDVE